MSTPDELTPHAAEIRLGQYGERGKPYECSNEKALYEIALTLLGEVQRLRKVPATRAEVLREEARNLRKVEREDTPQGALGTRTGLLRAALILDERADAAEREKARCGRDIETAIGTYPCERDGDHHGDCDERTEAEIAAQGEKDTATAATSTRFAIDHRRATTERHELLRLAIRDQGGEWTTRRVRLLYRGLGIRDLFRSTLRHDLAELCRAGHLTLHDQDKGRRYYTPTTNGGDAR